MARSELERNLIHDAMEQMEKCHANGDMSSVIMLIRLCKYIVGDDFKVWLEKDDKEDPFMNDTIDGYFTVRTCNVLKNGKILTVGELIKKSEDELWRLRYMGKKTFSEIKEFLAENGLKLKGEK